MKDSLPNGLIAAGLTFFFTTFAAWLTHIIVAIQAKAWLFMIVGALLPPVGVAHGVATWFGFDWLS